MHFRAAAGADALSQISYPSHRRRQNRGGRGLLVRLGLGALEVTRPRYLLLRAWRPESPRRRTPRAVEQTLAQLVYINFDLHGETSLFSPPLTIHDPDKHGSAASEEHDLRRYPRFSGKVHTPRVHQVQRLDAPSALP